MLKYYIFAFIKANLLALLIVGLIFLLNGEEFLSKYCLKIIILSNVFFQIMKPSYEDVEKIEDQWTWIRLIENKKWYHRYFDRDIKNRLK